jgi:hypothetical protein
VCSGDVSLVLARRRGARLVALRAATSLGRWWIARGRRRDARRVLAAVCRSVTERDGVDVEAARALLAEASARR